MLKLNKVSGRSSYLACSWTPTISTSLSEEVMLISSLIWVLPGEGLSLARKPGSKRPTRGTNAHTHNMLNGLHDSEMSWRRTFSNLSPPPQNCNTTIRKALIALLMVLSYRSEWDLLLRQEHFPALGVIRLSNCYFTSVLRATLHLNLSELQQDDNQ